MSFQDDLNRWASKRISKSPEQNPKAQLERLVRERVHRALEPLGPGIALPAEVRQSARPGEYTEPTEVLDWICWPSSDDAEYGWGDPYGPNPPLGTPQMSFSDTAHIARELNAQDVVVHGVNKIAGLRDWRSPPLVLSWTAGAVYSAGSEVLADSGILAACVRYESGTPYLLWAVSSTSPATIWKRECTIENEAVTGLVGATEFCTFALSVIYHAEFSENGMQLAVCNGSSLTSTRTYEIDVPAVFTGQALQFITEIHLVAQTTAHVAFFNNGQDYSGQRSYLLKSQYKDNVLKHARLELDITEARHAEVLNWISFADWGFIPDIPYRCEGACPSESIPWQVIWSPNDIANDGYKNLQVNQGMRIEASIEIDGAVAYSQRLADDSLETESWCMDDDPTSSGPQDSCQFAGPTLWDFEATGDEPAVTGPVSPWPCYSYETGIPVIEVCVPETGVQVSSFPRRDQEYRVIPVNVMDVRHARVTVLNFGSSPDNGATKNTQFALELYRNGQQRESDVRTGDYGYVSLPDKNDIGSENDLKNQLDLVARRICPLSGLGIGGTVHGVDVAALDVTETRSVQWARAQEVDGLYDHINQLEGANIEDLLSISGETEPRIVVHESDRWFGKLR